jgi:hypothetical protein
MKAMTNRGNEGLVRVVMFKKVNIDQSDDSEKGWMVMNHVKCYNIFKLINRWSGNRKLVKHSISECRTWRWVMFCPD